MCGVRPCNPISTQQIVEAFFRFYHGRHSENSFLPGENSSSTKHPRISAMANSHSTGHSVRKWVPIGWMRVAPLLRRGGSDSCLCRWHMPMSFAEVGRLAIQSLAITGAARPERSVPYRVQSAVPRS
jgi:hypothetical protein